jgi:hypothetical protein
MKWQTRQKKQKGPASGPGPFGGNEFLQLQTGATEMAPAGAAEAKTRRRKNPAV